MRDDASARHGALPSPRDDAGYARGLSRGFAALVAASAGLIVLGALVRAHGAGLACPDWPLCFGQWIPPLDFEVGFEWAHRVFAGAVSLAFVSLAALALARPGTRRAAGRTVALAAGLLALQVVLGGLTVLELLAAWTVTSHLLVGNAFAATLLWIAADLREVARPRRRSPLAGGRLAVLAVPAALLALQIVLGGLLSSRYAGLACPDWPACRDGVWFPTFQGLVGLALAHRLNAYAFVAALGAAALAVRGHPHLRRVTALALGLGLLQVGAGVANVLLEVPVEVTGLHSALAAALVLSLAYAVREGLRSYARRGRPLLHPLPRPS